MAGGAGAVSVAHRRRFRLRPVEPGSTPWLPTWSPAAAIRGVRAAIVMPTLFVIADKVIGNVQIATFAAFGSFATLVLAGFGGARRDKLIAHLGLALVGSVLLTIGTAVNASTVVAVVVTVPVTFVVFFAGIAGPNAAIGATAAMLAYVLPAASPGTFSMVPDRLAGWWLASVVGTAAVLLVSPPPGASRLRAVASSLAARLADQLDAMLRGEGSDEGMAACIEAKHELLAQFTSTPFRPIGLASPDEALASAVELLEWCASLVADTFAERRDLRAGAATDCALIGSAAGVLRDAGTLIAGGDARPDLDRLEQCNVHSTDRLRGLTPASDEFRALAQLSFHAHAIAVTSLSIGVNAVVAAGLEGADWKAHQIERWSGAVDVRASRRGRLGAVARVAGVAARHATVRSVWFVNSARAACALAVAVAVADVINVQHGFWVVLGTLSVLRTNAASTGATALRALLGTAVGFVVGAALLLVIGSSSPVLWAVLPVAVFVAAYAPGAAPFAVGQAAFTVTIAVLFNLLLPVGWRVGVIRIEDVAIGCAVSIVIGGLFWPRGVSAVVGDDLADAYRRGAEYLSEATRWVCGLQPTAPAGAIAAVSAGSRLDDALRGFLAEQGSKRIHKQALWRLVGGSMRLRLTAHAVSVLPRDDDEPVGPARDAIARRAEQLDAWYDRLAIMLGRPQHGPVEQLEPPVFAQRPADGNVSDSRPAVWLCEHLDHLTEHLHELVEPAGQLAAIRRRPWWR